MKSVYSAVRTGSLNIIKFYFNLLRFKERLWILRFDSQNKSYYFILAPIPGRRVFGLTQTAACNFGLEVVIILFTSYRQYDGDKQAASSGPQNTTPFT